MTFLHHIGQFSLIASVFHIHRTADLCGQKVTGQIHFGSILRSLVYTGPDVCFYTDGFLYVQLTMLCLMYLGFSEEIKFTYENFQQPLQAIQ